MFFCLQRANFALGHLPSTQELAAMLQGYSQGHFELQQENTVATCTAWIKEVKEKNAPQVASTVEGYLKSLQHILK